MYRPHPLRQSQSSDSSVARQPSTASSSASSGYSYTSDRSSGASSMTSHSSAYSSLGHKRGQSEASRLSTSFSGLSVGAPPKPNEENIYNNARRSLRPLPQAPAAGPAPPPPPVSPVKSYARHDRGQSVDIGRLSMSRENDRLQLSRNVTPQPPLSAIRPNSMILSRSDSINRGGSVAVAHAHTPPALHHAHTAPIPTPDFESLGKSSTNQLRTLSKLAQSASTDDFALAAPTTEVVGLRGRRRLQRAVDAAPSRAGQLTGGYGWEGRNWMDKQRQFLQAYEYLCHIGEAKEWIEDIIHRTIPPIVELEESLRDGVTLAEVVAALNPERAYRIIRHQKLQYLYSDNIAIFFRYLDEVELPDLFRFEMIDLYEKKNIPKVIYCLHALSWLLFRKGIVDFRIGNLVGQLEFEHHELEAMQKGLDKLGANMPSFGNIGADFDAEPPQPAETEEERVDRELSENAPSIVDLQAQARGALIRMQLGKTMQQLWDSEDWLIDLQSRIRGDWSRQVVDYRMEMRRFAINLQSATRGFLVRQRQTQKESYWKSMEDDILELQSLIRAKRVRNEVRATLFQLEQAAAPVRSIQAVFKGYLTRQKVLSQQQDAKQTSAATSTLQAAARGMLLRRRLEDEQIALEAESRAVVSLQAAARAMLMRSQVQRQMDALNHFAEHWEQLQAVSRGNSARQEVLELKAELRQHSATVEALQAHIRASAVRSEVAQLLDELQECEPGIVELQTRIRGMLQRQSVAADLDAMAAQTSQIIQLQAYARAFTYRQKHATLLQELRATEPGVVLLQGLARAMLLRSEVAELLNQLDEQEDAIVAFQAAAKAFLVQIRFAEKKRFFNENMQKVVKIQSFVRAKMQGEAYKSLTTGKNPPVNAVKNFVHLLNDSDFDFNEEVEFERMRKTVVQQVRQNEMLEQYIDQLDIKIALLVKNKITLDEVVRHQNNFGGHAGNFLASASISSANQFDLKALNKSSRKKLESYQQLFFNLQTQPQYLARLFRRVRLQGMPEKDCKRVELLIMSLFGYAQKRREEYYLLKLIVRSISEEVEGSVSIQDYLRGNHFWQKLLSHYTRSPRDRKYLRDLLGPMIRDNIIEDPALDLESDPMQIYRSAINNEELRTGQPSRRPRDVPREVAIKDPETRGLFIDHLRDLREICDQYLLSLEDLLPRLPYGMRFICRQMLDSLCQHFQREPPQQLLQLVSNWLWRFYLQPAVTAPENVGVVDKQLGPLQKRNLGEVAKVLGQIASGRPFGGDNIHLQPLNAFVAESVGRLNHIMEALVSVPDAESTFDIDEFNDLYAKNKPTLYIKMTDIFAIHQLVVSELPAMCPNRDDILREIVQELGSAKNNENEMTATGSSDIQMFLTPKLHDVEDPEADIKALFMETKRCVLYIIRVQTGANLLEILVKPIHPLDEQKWQALLREDFSAGSNTRGAYSDANMVDVTCMSYYDLKRTALENVLRLEQLGRISKHNHYQDVLNAIALDIRTKSRRRVQRQREVEGVRLTLSNLHEKAKYLEQQRKSYDDYIEQAMATLQNKKGKKRFLLPFTKQYNHQRELERSGRVPKFGSYKYSVRALAEKGVVVTWTGVLDRDYDKINLTISCDEVGVFSIEGSRGHIQIPGASALVSIEDLLQAQFEAHQFMNLFENNLRLNVNLLLHLLYKKFYRTQ
ncbi:Ras GTPase activating [Niveomyces insectorum RCEF 264]|uniref:Ras GTPase activating n=1 Tax=Niveomyces insectorum RCEF 264 TaxID=1081102 RepID=A0A162LBD5_9HYPO|nr:Ras GTPase activating [Niveomyces insectorum RCEF 264]